MHKKKEIRQFSGFLTLFLLTAVVSLAACGGGGGGGSSSGSGSGGSSSGGTNVPPAINAGSDQTVDAGDVVDLQVNASDSDGSILGQSWTQTGGPSVELSVIDLDNLQFQLLAPDTGGEDSIVIEFRFTVEDNDGASASDSVAIRVLRVNQSPQVDAGSAQTVDGLSDVTLTADATDPDGEIDSYMWEQTAGSPTVTMQGSDQESVSFEAPSTNEEIQLQFSVTVTDSDGETANDSVAVTVRPEDAPDIFMTFPPPTGAYTGSAGSISAFGKVQGKDDASISSVTVTAGSGEVEATLEPDGSWRADNIVVPDAVNAFTVTATATDSEDRTSTAQSELATSVTAANLSSSGDWSRTQALVAEPGEDRIWLLTTGDFLADLQLLPVDTQNGQRGESVTDFVNESQGPVVSPFFDMAYNPGSDIFYLSVNPAGADKLVLSVDGDTGQRSVISGPEQGEGPSLEAPAGVAVNGSGQLYVADFVAEVTFAVDPASGDRSIIIDADSIDFESSFPSWHLDWDNQQERLINWLNFKDGSLMTAVADPAGSASASVISDDLDGLAPTMGESAKAMAVDSNNQRAFLMTSGNQLLVIDLATGERTEIMSTPSGDQQFALAYDEETNLLYLAGGESDDQLLSVIDVDVDSPGTPTSIAISRSN